MARLDSSGMTPNTNVHWLTAPSGFSYFTYSSSFVIIKPLKSQLSCNSLNSSSFQLPYCVIPDSDEGAQSGISCLHKTAITYLLFNKHFYYRPLKRFSRVAFITNSNTPLLFTHQLRCKNHISDILKNT